IDGGRFTTEEEKEYSSSAKYRTLGEMNGFFTGSTNYVRETNLAQLIYDASQPSDASNQVSGTNNLTGLCNGLDPGQCLSVAEQQFRHTYLNPANPDGWIARNIIQERLIMASNSACREFTQHLNTFQSSSNFVLGAAAVGTGAAGAIVTAA